MLRASIQSTNTRQNSQDIKLGPGITIHKVDEILSFGAPLQLFTARAGYSSFNAALGAANLGIDFGLSGSDTATLLNVSDFTVFVPDNAAFARIGSVLESADVATLQNVLRYHFVPNVVFSTGLGNVTVTTLQGDELTVSVFPDGSAFVNGAKITFANNILWNGVVHVIDK